MQRLHASSEDGTAADCGGEVRDYHRRFHPPESSSYTRTFLLRWCSDCRTYASYTVHVDRDVVLDDPLAVLTPDERRRLVGKELHLVRHLDRVLGRGRR